MTGYIVGPPIILYSPKTGEQYSATKGDYFLVSHNNPLKDAENNNLWLVQTEYNDLGNLGIAKVLKRKVTLKDLPDSDRVTTEIA